MTRKKQVYLFLLSLSMMILIGCGKSTSETKEVTDGSVVVQVPEGSTVESLFDFTSTENICCSYFSDRNRFLDWIFYFEIKRQFQATGKSESKNSGKTSTKRKHRMVCS